VSINCAKCPDHPRVPEWSQAITLGWPSSVIARILTKKHFLAERRRGKLKFARPPGREKEEEARCVSDECGSPRTGLAERATPKRQAGAEKLDGPKRSRDPRPNRQCTVGGLTMSMVGLGLRFPIPNGLFRSRLRTATWARLFGPRLVTPLEQRHPEKASHPEILSGLACAYGCYRYGPQRTRARIVSDAR